MSNAKPFQLDPAMFKTGNPLLDGFIKGRVKDINKADWNKNGTPDVSEYAAVIGQVIPCLVALDHCIDFEKLAEQLAANPAVKDRVLLKETLLQLGKSAEAAGKLLPLID